MGGGGAERTVGQEAALLEGDGEGRPGLGAQQRDLTVAAEPADQLARLRVDIGLRTAHSGQSSLGRGGGWSHGVAELGGGEGVAEPVLRVAIQRRRVEVDDTGLQRRVDGLVDLLLRYRARAIRNDGPGAEDDVGALNGAWREGDGELLGRGWGAGEVGGHGLQALRHLERPVLLV